MHNRYSTVDTYLSPVEYISPHVDVGVLPALQNLHCELFLLMHTILQLMSTTVFQLMHTTHLTFPIVVVRDM